MQLGEQLLVGIGIGIGIGGIINGIGGSVRPGVLGRPGRPG